MEFIFSLEDIASVADIIVTLNPHKVILFHGEMGAGKTTLIRELVKALGVQDTASSPTFSLVNHYESEKGPVFHFDFYRIEDDSEALDIGLEDYLDSGEWNLIEWPEKIEKLLGDNTQKLLIQVESTDTRKLKFC